jgi:hypothetical protein
MMNRLTLFVQHALYNNGILGSIPDDILLQTARTSDGTVVYLLKIASRAGGCFRTLARNKHGAGVYIGRRMNSRRDAEQDFNAACERFNAHPSCEETPDNAWTHTASPA